MENQFKPEYLEMENENSLQVIHKAAEMGRLEIVKFLHKKKCSLEVSDKNGLRPIHYASGGGHLNILQYLIENNCDKEACDNTDKTPLLYACDGNHIDIVEFLLKCGAKIRASDKDGRGPIHYACRGGFVDLVKKLCENHCKIEQSDDYGWRPIHYVSHSGILELVEYLDGQRCLLEIKDQEEEWTPMHHACNGGHLNVVRYLHSRNCSINVTDKNGLVPFDHACKNGHLKIMKFFHGINFDLERTIEHGMRPLHYACKYGQIDIVRFLFNANCNIEAKDKLGWRPIHHAVSNSHKEVVTFLILNHCDKEATTNNGLTALDLTKDLNNETMKNLFMKDIISLKIEERIRNAKNHSCGNFCDQVFCLNKTFSEKSLNFIGSGSFGRVYKIRDQTTNVDIAVRIINLHAKGFNNKSKYIKDDINLYQEILNHKSIVRYYGYVVQGNHNYIFMEYAPGGALGKAIQKSGPLKHPQIIGYCGQALEGLDYLHKNHIIHRNVKPYNILLFPNDCIKLCGFGLSRFIETISNNEDDNEAETFVGTHNYMAPEMIIGDKYGYSIDIWSLGASIVEMLTGRPPYSNFSTMAAIFRIGTIKTIEFQPHEPMSVEFDNFLREMLNPNPSQRPTATDLLRSLSKMTKSKFQKCVEYFEYVQSGDLSSIKNKFESEYLEMKSKNSRQIIHEAAKSGNLDIVEFLHQNQCNLEATDNMDKTALHYSCEGNHGLVVNFLLKSHSNVEVCDKNGCRPIHYVCRYGFLDLLKALCEKGCDIESKDKRGWRPIHYVSNNGHLELITYLNIRECDLKAKSSEKDWSPLHHACDGGHLDIVRYLYSKQSNFYLIDKYGLVPLDYACINGHLSIVEFFHDKGMDLEHRDNNGRKPIHHACKHGHIEIVKFLFGVNCDMNAEDMMGWKPVDHAKEAHHTEIVDFILSNSVLKPLNVTTVEDNSNKGNCNEFDEIPRYLEIEERINYAINNQCISSCDHLFCFTKLFSEKSKDFIDSGAFGSVYKDKDPKTNVTIAVKMMETKSEDGNREARYLEHDINRYRETLLHERVIKYYAASIQNAKIYIFMEYAEKGSLHTEIRKKISEKGSLEHPQIIRYSRQILEGLTFLHGKRVIHRDIKPKNILLFPNDCIKICDFGLSKFIETISNSNTSKDKGCLVGSPNYMAPEVILGEHHGFSADIWSLGATMVEMFSGRPPYYNLVPVAVIFRIGQFKIIEFQPCNPISHELNIFHQKMLESDHTKRCSADQLLKDIDFLS